MINIKYIWKLMENPQYCYTRVYGSEMGVVRDWRKALRSPPAYKIINRTIRGQTQFILLVAIMGLFVLIVLYLPTTKNSVSVSNIKTFRNTDYNSTYPLTPPVKTGVSITFRIGIIADLDTVSKNDGESHSFHSYLKKGLLTYNPKVKSILIKWDHNQASKLISHYALKGRGMELSELVVFNGKLLTFDDRTGLVYEIINDEVVPWILLTDGNGRTSKGFKSEWASVKDGFLYVGSMGKEWTTPGGVFESNNPQYIKIVSTKGEVNHVSWIEQYNRIRGSIDIVWPGYMIHESATWSHIHQKWFFLPRRCSTHSYNESLDEHRGCSVLIIADESITDFKVVQIANFQPTRGFSSFKFIPGFNDQVIVALRTEELDGKTATYITSFTIDGDILLDDTLVSNLKYEGLEFI